MEPDQRPVNVQNHAGGAGPHNKAFEDDETPQEDDIEEEDEEMADNRNNVIT